MSDLTLNDIFNKKAIIERAKEHWNFKDDSSKIKASHKYNHIFFKRHEVVHNWRNHFDALTQQQQVILIKGELIRTYDALPNSDKTEIKKSLGLSTFASKWYKLPSVDKAKLLEYVT